MKTLVALILLPIVWGAYFIALFLMIMWKLGIGGLLKIMWLMLQLAWIPLKIFLMMFGILSFKKNHY